MSIRSAHSLHGTLFTNVIFICEHSSYGLTHIQINTEKKTVIVVILALKLQNIAISFKTSNIFSKLGIYIIYIKCIQL